jgi:protein-arginine kinase
LAYDEKLGYVTSNYTSLGSTIRATITVDLPKSAQHEE